jgi:Acetyltransferase (GNAT) family
MSDLWHALDGSLIKDASAQRMRWEDVQTGRPALLYLWHAKSYGTGALTPEWQGKLGREFLLGDGMYFAPTPALASSFGSPEPYEVELRNPFVIERANGTSMKDLDPADIASEGYDSIMVRSGQFGFGGGQESLRQVVLFPSHASQARQIDKIPTATETLDVGTEVMTPDGDIGKITSFTSMGTVSVKVKGQPKVQTFAPFQLRWPDGSKVADNNGWGKPLTMYRPGERMAAAEKRIDYCKVCGQRIQKIDTWKHQRPQPNGKPWDHAAEPGGTKTATLQVERPWDGASEEGSVTRSGYKRGLGYVIQQADDGEGFVWVTLAGTQQTPVDRGVAATLEQARAAIDDNAKEGKTAAGPIKFVRSTAVPGRLIADNGKDLIDDASYISAAIDKDREGGYVLRFWVPGKGRPVHEDWFDRQDEAKRVGITMLTESLDAGDHNLEYWISNSYHQTYMRTLYGSKEASGGGVEQLIERYLSAIPSGDAALLRARMPTVVEGATGGPSFAWFSPDAWTLNFTDGGPITFELVVHEMTHVLDWAAGRISGTDAYAKGLVPRGFGKDWGGPRYLRESHSVAAEVFVDAYMAAHFPGKEGIAFDRLRETDPERYAGLMEIARNVAQAGSVLGTFSKTAARPKPVSGYTFTVRDDETCRTGVITEAWFGGQLVGRMSFNISWPYLSVWKVDVDAAHRRKGLATQLLWEAHAYRPDLKVLHSGFSSDEGQEFAESTPSSWNRVKGWDDRQPRRPTGVWQGLVEM